MTTPVRKFVSRHAFLFAILLIVAFFALQWIYVIAVQTNARIAYETECKENGGSQVIWTSGGVLSSRKYCADARGNEIILPSERTIL